jgi:hypothetical protein
MVCEQADFFPTCLLTCSKLNWKHDRVTSNPERPALSFAIALQFLLI